jgi:hypothetical protein
VHRCLILIKCDRYSSGLLWDMVRIVPEGVGHAIMTMVSAEKEGKQSMSDISVDLQA